MLCICSYFHKVSKNPISQKYWHHVIYRSSRKLALLIVMILSHCFFFGLTISIFICCTKWSVFSPVLLYHRCLQSWDIADHVMNDIFVTLLILMWDWLNSSWNFYGQEKAYFVLMLTRTTTTNQRMSSFFHFIINYSMTVLKTNSFMSNIMTKKN